MLLSAHLMHIVMPKSSFIHLKGRKASYLAEISPNIQSEEMYLRDNLVGMCRRSYRLSLLGPLGSALYRYYALQRFIQRKLVSILV